MQEPQSSLPDSAQEKTSSLSESGGATPEELQKLVSAASQIAEESENSDSRAKKEEAWFEQKRAELQSFVQDTRQRKAFAIAIFSLIVLWLAGIFIILLLAGFLGDGGGTFTGRRADVEWVLTLKFKLSDGVLLALIGGTTVNVLGILILVVQYLFPKRPSR